MQTYFHALYPGKKNLKVISLFGYCSRGIPGVELVNLPESKALKEKLVYHTRLQKKKLPLQRFMICCEDSIDKKEASEIRHLELPLLILLWSLAGLVPIKRLEDCLSFGKISPSGRYLLSREFLSKFEKEASQFQHFKVISPRKASLPKEFYHLPLEDIIK